VIRIQGLALSRGTTRLLDGADASISAGERVALIGLNGSGKSTLFAALTGDLAPDQGSVAQPYSRVTLLRQSAPSGSMPAWRYLLDGDTRLCAAERALEAAQACMLELEQFADQSEPGSPEEAGLALAQANAEWLDAGGADARPRAMALLAGLGFREGQSEEPVDHLSGGWRMRLNLARALFDPGNLLLLDEPTNHLDLDAIVWLERWLQRLEGTLIVISHDRDFLDRVVHSSLHIDEGKLVRYAGGYSEFERLRAERQRQAAREQKAIAERNAHLQAFINRFRAQASKARQVQSRVKALERMSNVAAIGALRGVDIRLEDPGDSPDPLLIAEDLDVGYSETPILRRVNLQLRLGARIGILGRNGAGKSTLIRTLVGELTPISGALIPSRTLRIGYFDQQAIERLEGARSPLELFAREAPTEREQTLRDRLGRFGFRGEDAARPVGTMSGGEKARLSLALIAWHKPHLLVLDEPTNHLDAQTRDSLAEAIAGFEGAVLLVSHDRYLLRASVDELVWVDNGALSPYDGDLDDYAQWVLKRREDSLAQPDRGTRAGVATPTSPPADRKAERRNAAQRRSDLAAATRPLDKEIATLETRLAQIQKRVADIELRLQDAGLYDAPNSADLLARLARERGELGAEQEQLEGRWFALQSQREAVLEAYRSQEGAA
jgi:ATP-binding cassette subfamily F protein 3